MQHNIGHAVRCGTEILTEQLYGPAGLVPMCSVYLHGSLNNGHTALWDIHMSEPVKEHLKSLHVRCTATNEEGDLRFECREEILHYSDEKIHQ